MNLTTIESQLNYFIEKASLIGKAAKVDSDSGRGFIALLDNSKLLLSTLKDSYPEKFNHISIDDQPAIANHPTKGDYYSNTKIDSLIISLKSCLTIVRNMVNLNIPTEINAIDILESIAKNFSRSIRPLQHRYGERPKFEITDEYDIQDIFESHLLIFFNDVRKEDYIPEVAGSNSRIDFVLPKERIGIEIKKTSARLSAQKLGGELAVDKVRYKGHSDFDTVFCFVYDIDKIITNPFAIENDLAKDNSTEYSMIVRIFPKI